MSTSPTTWLSKPKDDKKISAGTFGYINARIRQRAYNLVVKEFKKSGISQATLARRWGKTPDIVSRLLARPGNWELNTFAEALFAINGAILSFGALYADEAEVPKLQFSSAQLVDPEQPTPVPGTLTNTKYYIRTLEAA